MCIRDRFKSAAHPIVESPPELSIADNRYFVMSFSVYVANTIFESFGVLNSLEAQSALFRSFGCSFQFHDFRWSAMHVGGRRVYSSWVALHAYCMGFVCDTTWSKLLASMSLQWVSLCPCRTSIDIFGAADFRRWARRCHNREGDV